MYYSRLDSWGGKELRIGVRFVGKSGSSSGEDPESGQSLVDLTTTLYGELRKLAAARMSGQQGPQTLQATALVHEAWLRLGGDAQPEWSDKRHFIAAAATAMRSILVDRARHRKALRHGGGLSRVDMDAWNWETLDTTSAERHDERLLELNDAMERLAISHPEAVELLQMRYFGGFQVAELSEVLGLTKRTTERRLAYACALLGRETRRSKGTKFKP